MMLRPRQVVICAALAGVYWILATLCIRLDPGGVAPGLRGDLSFATSVFASWFCVWLVCRLAKLEPHQILAGAMVVLGDAMLIDGAALRWFPTVYGVDDHLARTGAAWLLWGYGISAWIAFMIAERRLRSGKAGSELSLATI